MVIMNIAEWIANLLILGIAVGIWVIAIFGIMLITVTLINGYKKLKI
tara:strand:+ start:169 stop:309 length:141 start_codon:yes stop_codon:yes gene_type:complete